MDWMRDNKCKFNPYETRVVKRQIRGQRPSSFLDSTLSWMHTGCNDDQECICAMKAGVQAVLIPWDVQSGHSDRCLSYRISCLDYSNRFHMGLPLKMFKNFSWFKIMQPDCWLLLVIRIMYIVTTASLTTSSFLNIFKVLFIAYKALYSWSPGYLKDHMSLLSFCSLLGRPFTISPGSFGEDTREGLLSGCSQWLLWNAQLWVARDLLLHVGFKTVSLECFVINLHI